MDFHPNVCLVSAISNLSLSLCLFTNNSYTVCDKGEVGLSFYLEGENVSILEDVDWKHNDLFAIL